MSWPLPCDTTVICCPLTNPLNPPTGCSSADGKNLRRSARVRLLKWRIFHGHLQALVIPIIPFVYNEKSLWMKLECWYFWLLAQLTYLPCSTSMLIALFRSDKTAKVSRLCRHYQRIFPHCSAWSTSGRALCTKGSFSKRSTPLASWQILPPVWASLRTNTNWRDYGKSQTCFAADQPRMG